MFKGLKFLIGFFIMFTALNTSSSMSAEDLYDLSFNSIDGSQIYLSDFKDKTIVIVNTASFCGFTRQFSGLQNIWEKYKKDGLVVIGIPSNDFNQEAKTNAEVKDFCEINFDVDFVLSETSNVRGQNAHPLFKFLFNNLGPRSVPKWNFYKYIIDKHGVPVDYYSSVTGPESEKFIIAIENELYS